MKKLLAIILLLPTLAMAEEYLQEWEFCGAMTGSSTDEIAMYTEWSRGFLFALEGYVNKTSESEFFARIWDLCTVEPDITIYSAARAVHMAGGYEYE